jgi:stage II sporulation protein M
MVANGLNRQYAAAGRTLCQARYGILVAMVVYAGSCLGGWLYADALDVFQQAASSLAGKFADKAGADFIFALFLHNLVATYTAMCLLTLWGLVPLVTAMANGLILGWIAATVNVPSLNDVAAALVPHGIFEWPAMIIAWGLGLWRGAGYRFNADPGTYFQRWKRSNHLFFLIVFPLLLLAAIVEGREHLFEWFPG